MRFIKVNLRFLNVWSIFSFLFVLGIIFSNLLVFTSLFQAPSENWEHIKEYLLADYIKNTLLLITFTGTFTFLIGTSLAWLISFYDFPLRNFYKLAFILPLAIPTYIGAYTYTGLLNYTGIVQSSLRNYLNYQVNPKLFDIMNIGGAVFIFTLFLLPYVYTIVSSFFQNQSSSLIETARLLGRKPLNILLTILLPLARPAIIGGVSLVVLEVLNDYGVVKYFGITTFSTAIFKSWFGMGDIDSAIRLAASLLIIVFFILTLEKMVRGRKRFDSSTSKLRPITLQKLSGYKALLAFTYSFLIFSLSFLIPILQLLYWSLITYNNVLNNKFWQLLVNSISVALVATCTIVFASVIVANFQRISGTKLSKAYAKITTFGYSIPGAVIAIGVMVLFISLDRKLFWFYNIVNPESAELVLSMSLAMLIFAYVIRFLAIGFNSVQTGFEKIGKKFFEASRTLGMTTTKTFFKIDLPMLKPALVGGFVLAFVDVLKELPLTLILRPFNFDTLATKVYQYASDEMIPEAGVPSLIIIVVSLISIFLLNKMIMKEEG
ncbi:MAG: iron ABC transporter [Gracilibacter sp. BRH_c7a]|nr:MAG: iron ABC transporter [Gracilibacter sp. BRH_c7a]